MVGVHSRESFEQATLEALGELYESRYHAFLRLAEAIVREVETAHDVVQEAFALAIRGRSGFRGEGSLEAWIWRSVVNVARSALRARGAHARAVEELPDAPSLDGRAADDRTRRIIAGLPERQRLVLFLRYYADLDYRGIATALDIRPGTVAATLNQAHAAVRRHLEEVSA